MAEQLDIFQEARNATERKTQELLEDLIQKACAVADEKTDKLVRAMGELMDAHTEATLRYEGRVIVCNEVLKKYGLKLRDDCVVRA